MNPRVTEVKPAIDFQLELTFSNRQKTKVKRQKAKG